MKISIRLSGDEAIKTKLTRAHDALEGAPLSRALLTAGLVVAGQAQRNVTSGGTGLHVRTGRLRSSIGAELLPGSAVTIGTNVVYARIHEFGGRTRPMTIEPVRRTALRFTVGGRTVFAKRVSHPGSHIPARPYLRPAVDQRRAQVLDILRRVYAGPLNIAGQGA
jgi:phage gpG-like protein